MTEFWNVIAVFISGLIAGAAIHSAWLHSKKRGEFKRKWGINMSVQLKMDLGGIEEFRVKIMYLPEDIRHRVYEAMNSIAQDIVRRAKELCPVRTGRLMHSIYAHVSRDMVLKVGATAPYAIYQEFGTRYIEPRAFLRQAIMENIPKLAMLMREALRLSIEEASKRR